MKLKKVDVKNGHFIPSPFPAVTAYENDFLKVWNENTAEAVAEVVKYIAQVTASAIKDTGGKKE